MPFVATKSMETLGQPSTLMLLSALLGLVLLGIRMWQIGMILVASPIMILAALAILPLDSWALAPLEDRFPPLLDVPGHMEGIVCLGGAVDPEMTEARGMPALNDAAERMTAFVVLALAHPEARLAFTGGSGRVFRGGLAEADVARMLFDRLGLAGRPITYERDSRTTWENARALAALLHPQAGQVWVLVTSAAHMPRAVGAFRAAGWTVLADPVGYKTAPALRVELAPSLPERVARLDGAWHEWLGLLAYRLLGRTRELLPAPVDRSRSSSRQG